MRINKILHSNYALIKGNPREYSHNIYLSILLCQSVTVGF